jgi:hypothetical protein
VRLRLRGDEEEEGRGVVARLVCLHFLFLFLFCFCYVLVRADDETFLLSTRRSRLDIGSGCGKRNVLSDGCEKMPRSELEGAYIEYVY